MNVSDITYKINCATESEIYFHLYECSDNFDPPLATKVNIEHYAKKICGRSVTFEAWSANILIGLIAAYFNDSVRMIGYITNVSIINSYMGLGIAGKLMKNCIEYAQKNRFNEIGLEVGISNDTAVQLYKKYGFVSSQKKGELLFMTFIVNANDGNLLVDELTSGD